MNAIIEFLNGKKTYISAVAAALFNLALAFGWLGEISAEQIIAIEGLLAAILGVTIRLGIAKK